MAGIGLMQKGTVSAVLQMLPQACAARERRRWSAFPRAGFVKFHHAGVPHDMSAIALPSTTMGLQAVS